MLKQESRKTFNHLAPTRAIEYRGGRRWGWGGVGGAVWGRLRGRVLFFA